MKKFIFSICILASCNSAFSQQNFYDTNVGSGNGFRFWGGNDSYKIHMGGGPEYRYGPVTDISIKSSVSISTGYGWTWGGTGATPLAALGTNGNMKLAGAFTSSRIGIGTDTPGAKLSFNDLNDGTNLADGITWLNSSPLDYGLYRSSGAWSSPNYQQLTMHFETGIVLDPGAAYGKSYVDIKGGGLRVTSGNVGIGTTAPANSSGWDKVLDVRGTNSKILSTTTNEVIKTGVFSHAAWSGGGGFVGTESDHSLFFVTNYNPKMVITSAGNVGIGTGTSTLTAKLSVNGQVNATEVKVTTAVPGPDYVFEKSYALPSLEEVKSYIDQNKHLPEVPSAKEMETNGVNLGEMNMLLLKKVEELTLYLIEQDKINSELRLNVKELQSRVNQVQSHR